ncbi:DNA polymerase III subunit delta' [Lachnospiraceae bacterium]|nr:DNA polymerase III subunit delta' [Lachnospiraceae bacterium]
MYNFSDVLGQDSVKQHLQRAVEADRVSHAYMLIGEAGMGKCVLAQSFAKLLLCEHNTRIPCGVCHSCRQIEAGTHPDVRLLRREKPSSISVRDVREQLAEEVFIRPFSGRKRIFIVPEAEKMTPEAQNAVLKTIEEPPEYAVILLLTESEGGLLETVRSRCVKLKFRPVSERLLSAYLQQSLLVSEEDAVLAARFARGIPARAVQLLQESQLKERILHCIEIAAELPGKKAGEFLREQAWILETFEELPDFLSLLRMYYRDLLSVKKGCTGNPLIFSGQERLLVREAGELTMPAVGAILDEINRTEDRLKANVNPEVSLELLLRVIQKGGRKG